MENTLRVKTEMLVILTETAMQHKQHENREWSM